MRRRNIGAAVITTIVVAAALAGCTQTSTPRATTAKAPIAATPSSSADTSTAPGSTAPGSTDASTAPGSSTTSAAAEHATVPTSCTDLVSDSAANKTFTTAPLNDKAVVGDPIEQPKSVFSSVVKPGSASVLCVWRDPRADISGLSLTVLRVDPTGALAVARSLPAKGFTCEPFEEGTRCQKVSTDPEYGVEVGDTEFIRGDVAIGIQQANVPTTNLLHDVTSHIGWAESDD
jgi:hypothetical protein